jgi:hypothetical protein
MKKCINLNVDVPDGYETTGEYRQPIIEEPFLDEAGKLFAGKFAGHCGPRIILRRVDKPAVRPMTRNEILVILTKPHMVISVCPEFTDEWDSAHEWNVTEVLDNFDRIRYAFITESGVIGQPQKFEKRI